MSIPRTMLFMAGGLAGLFAALPSPEAPLRSPGEAGAAVAALAEPIETRTAGLDLSAALSAPAAEEQGLLFPDGSRLPALNGAIDPPPVRWDPSVPYAEVVRRERDGRGVDWYVHADGTYSTTQMAWRSDLGREVGTTLVARPLEAF